MSWTLSLIRSVGQRSGSLWPGLQKQLLPNNLSSISLDDCSYYAEEPVFFWKSEVKVTVIWTVRMVSAHNLSSISSSAFKLHRMIVWSWDHRSRSLCPWNRSIIYIHKVCSAFVNVPYETRRGVEVLITFSVSLCLDSYWKKEILLLGGFF